MNENDNNKNRKYAIVDRRINATYVKESAAHNKNKLYDPYVRFLRWAIDRLNGRDGIVCFVTNNSFVVDLWPFDGMRKLLAADFTRIYHIDLHGNVFRNPKLSGTAHNVFGIKVGVGITVAIRKRSGEQQLYYHRVPETWRRGAKLAWLSLNRSVMGVECDEISPDAKSSWVRLTHEADFDDLVPLGAEDVKRGTAIAEEAIFRRFSIGVKSNRDEIVYDFDRRALKQRIKDFAEKYNSEIGRYKRRDGDVDIDDFVDPTHIKWSESLKANLRRAHLRQIRGEKTCLLSDSTVHNVLAVF